MKKRKNNKIISSLILIVLTAISIGVISKLGESNTNGEIIEKQSTTIINTEMDNKNMEDTASCTEENTEAIDDWKIDSNIENKVDVIITEAEDEIETNDSEEVSSIELNVEPKKDSEEVKKDEETKVEVKTETEVEDKKEDTPTEEKVDEIPQEKQEEELVEPKLPVEGLKSIGNSKQVIIVTGDYGISRVSVNIYEKINNKWTTILSCTGFIGSKGFAVNKVEGDKKTPRGMYTLGTGFGRYENPGTKMPYEQTDTNDVWVDDSNSEFYNTWHYKDQNNGQWNSAENLYIVPYNYSLVINYNTSKRVPGKGSAIFMHVSAKPTAGCVGVSESNMIKVLRWLDPSKNPVIIMSPKNELSQY